MAERSDKLVDVSGRSRGLVTGYGPEVRTKNVKIFSLRTLFVFVGLTCIIFLASCCYSFVGTDSLVRGWPIFFIAREMSYWEHQRIEYGPRMILWDNLAESLAVHAVIAFTATMLYLLVFGALELVRHRRSPHADCRGSTPHTGL